jgi:hypothetical protein
MFLVEWPGGSWETTAALTAAVIGIYIAVFWAALVFWTVRDAHQRTENPINQAGAGLLVLAFFLPGHWLYLILRPRTTLAERFERSLEAEAVLQELQDRANCPNCARRVQDDFVLCPTCKAQLKEPCTRCSRPLNFAWVVCPSCGLEPHRRTAAQQVAIKATKPEREKERPAEPVAAKEPAQRKLQPQHVVQARRRETAPLPRPGVPAETRRQPASLPRPGVTAEAQPQATAQLSGGTPGS